MDSPGVTTNQTKPEPTVVPEILVTEVIPRENGVQLNTDTMKIFISNKTDNFGRKRETITLVPKTDK